MKRVYTAVILTVLTLLSCSQKPGDSGDSTLAGVNGAIDTIAGDTMNAVFTPPADGIITEDMSERYIMCAKDINTLIQQRAEAGKNYLDSLGVTYEQLADSAFKTNNKEIVDNYNNITVGGNFTESEKSIYRKYSMTEDEFIWIASHLSNPENAEIQAKVTEALLEIIAP